MVQIKISSANNIKSMFEVYDPVPIGAHDKIIVLGFIYLEN